MKHILVYSDSISWGIIHTTRNRFPFHQRWPGILENNLNKAGKDVRVIEDCLNGRRTIYNDPIRPGRNGLIGLSERIEVNSPLELVILMLGTNDFQANHEHTAEDAAKEAHDFGLRRVKVYVKGPGAGRESAIRSLNNTGIEVTEIIDVTPLPHNGCRPPKRRRV